MRKKLIAANWKMYKTPEQTAAFFRDFLPLVADHTRDEIVVCPPFIDLQRRSRLPAAPTSRLARRTCTGKKKAPSPARFPRSC